jgi:hypothetical protein
MGSWYLTPVEGLGAAPQINWEGFIHCVSPFLLKMDCNFQDKSLKWGYMVIISAPRGQPLEPLLLAEGIGALPQTPLLWRALGLHPKPCPLIQIGYILIISAPRGQPSFQSV